MVMPRAASPMLPRHVSSCNALHPMHEQGNRQQPHYNEVIVATSTYAEQLPASLEAVFVLSTSPGDAQQHAGRADQHEPVRVVSTKIWEPRNPW